MFLVKQFMDNAVAETFPLEEASVRLREATYDQLIACKHIILDDAWNGVYVSDRQRKHIYGLNQTIGAAIAERNARVEGFKGDE